MKMHILQAIVHPNNRFFPFFLVYYEKLLFLCSANLKIHLTNNLKNKNYV